MKRSLVVGLVDIAAGLSGTAAVILLTDASGADLRVYFLAAVAVFGALGLWRSRRAGWPTWIRVALIAGMPLVLALQSLLRFWPPAGRELAYIALFPLLQVAALSAAFAAQRGRPSFGWVPSARAWSGTVLATAVLGAVTMPAFSRWMGTDDTVRPLPPIAFETFAGEPVSSEAWRGKVVVLDFWASWCLPCIAELEELEVLHRRYAGRDDVVFWAVSARDERARAERFARESPHTLPWGWDPGDAAFTALESRNIPSLYLIDREGRIRLTHIGYSRSEGFLEHVGGRLDELVDEGEGAGL